MWSSFSSWRRSSPGALARLATRRVVDPSNGIAIEPSALLSIHRVYAQAPLAGRTCGAASHGERSCGRNRLRPAHRLGCRENISACDPHTGETVAAVADCGLAPQGRAYATRPRVRRNSRAGPTACWGPLTTKRDRPAFTRQPPEWVSAFGGTVARGSGIDGLELARGPCPDAERPPYSLPLDPPLV
jgi:hypothetical protein